MHPITCEILSKVDKYDRARQREAFQLQNRLTTTRAECPNILVQRVNALGTLMMATGARLKDWKMPSSSQAP